MVVRQHGAGSGDDAPLIGERQVLRQRVERDPGGVDGLLVRVVLDGEVAAGGAQQEMMDELVDAVAADGEPVVDAAEGGDDIAVHTGLLSDLAAGRLGGCLTEFQVALRQAPFEPAGPVDACDDRHLEGGRIEVDHDAARGDLLHGVRTRRHDPRLRQWSRHSFYCISAT